MSRRKHFRDIVIDESEKVRHEEHAINLELRNRGWKYTSDTITSDWMWEKEIQGKVYLVSRSMAIEIEIRLDDDLCVPSEYDDDEG